MARHKTLQRVGADRRAARARKDGIGWSTPLRGKPCFKDGRDIGSKRCAACLPSLSEAADMSSGSEFHVTMFEGNDLAVAQARLGCEKQERAIPPADPGSVAPTKFSPASPPAWLVLQC